MLDIFYAALDAVDPYKAVRRSVQVKNGFLEAGTARYDLSRFDRVIAVGAGKASARMALALEEIFPAATGLVIVKYGHVSELHRIEQVEAGHPLPDESGLRGTERILDLVRTADERTLILCLISGGGSSLLVMPATGISLDQKQKTTDLLLRAGASIAELNSVRKHLSRVKGGRLAQAAYPATVLALILSDVVGDSLDVIASGPVSPDSSTFSHAVAVINKYNLRNRLPQSVVSLLEHGERGKEPETAKGDDVCFKNTQNLIVAGLGQALSAARNRALALGFSAEIVNAMLQGEASAAGFALAEKALVLKEGMTARERRCLLSGGETTVTVRGSGVGGRNQELALAFAVSIEGIPGIELLSAGTDGTDGPTDAAGAFVDGTTARKAREHGLDPGDFLARNDSYTFFERLDALTNAGTHVKTGPTGTNVMDMQILCLERD